MPSVIYLFACELCSNRREILNFVPSFELLVNFRIFSENFSARNCAALLYVCQTSDCDVTFVIIAITRVFQLLRSNKLSCRVDRCKRLTEGHAR